MISGDDLRKWAEEVLRKIETRGLLKEEHKLATFTAEVIQTAMQAKQELTTGTPALPFVEYGLEPVDEDFDQDEILTTLYDFIEILENAGFPKEFLPSLKVITDNIDTFMTHPYCRLLNNCLCLEKILKGRPEL